MMRGGVSLSVETVAYVEVQRLAVGSGFLGAVEHSDALCSLGDSGKEVLCRERTIQVYGYETYLLALGAEVVDSFLSGFCHRAHCDDNAIGFGISVVVEETVLTSGDAGDLLHVSLNDLRHTVVVFVT